MSLNWNFQRGEGFNPKNPLWGEYGCFVELHNANLHSPDVTPTWNQIHDTRSYPLTINELTQGSTKTCILASSARNSLVCLPEQMNLTSLFSRF